MSESQSMGGIHYDVAMDVKPMLSGERQVGSSLDRMEGNFNKASKSIDSAEKSMLSFSKAALAVSSAISVGAIVNMVDEWGQVAARIKMALKSVEGDITKYGAIQERFLEISNRNGKAIEDTQLLYVGAATSMQELGYNTEQTVDYIESLSSSLTANAASANETKSMINALNKAMVSGKVAGENWNSIMNATPTLIGDIAKQLSIMRGGVKVTEQDVKKLAADGKISFQLFADAVIRAKEANNAMADSMDNTVADGFTKLTNSAKAYYGELNQSLGITRSVSAGFAVLTENFDYLASAIAAVVAIGAAKYFGDLSNRIVKFGADSAKAAIDSKRLAVEKLNTARASLQQIQAEKAFAVATQQSLSAQLSATQAESRRSSIRRQLAANSAEITTLTKAETAATNQLAAAQSRLSVASRAASGAMNLLKSGFSLIGGPAGAAMLATGAIFYFYQEMQRSRDEAVKLANGLDGLITRMQDMNREQKKSELSNINTALLGLAQVVGKSGEAVRDAQEELDKWNQKLSRAKEGSDAYVVAQKGAERAQKSLTAAIQESEKASNDYQKAKSAIRILQADLNGELKQGAELLSHEAKTLLPNGSAALRQYGVDLDNATKSKQKFNSQSLFLDYGGEKGENLKKQIERDLALSKVEGEAKVKLQVSFAAADAGVTDKKAIERLQENAIATFNNNEAKKENVEQTKVSTKTTDEAGEALKRLQAELTRLNKGYAEGSLELAQYDAAQALGSKASPEQIALAKERAKSIWEVQAATKAATKAEEDRKNSQANFTSLQESVSPVTAIDNQFAKQMEQINQYKQLYPQSIAEAEALRSQIEEQYRQKRMDAQWQELSNASLGYNMLTSAVDSFGGNASNVITGLVTGTMSAADAMRSLGNTILNSVVNSIVQVGVEMLKNFILAQTVGVASQAANTAAATAGGAAALAAWTPAAIAASIATGGAASATGLTAFKTSLAVGQSMSMGSFAGLAGARYSGGPVNAGEMYRVGEHGKPEIYRASSGKQYMIPGDNGRVISNKDMQGGGAPTVIINLTNNTSAQPEFGQPRYDQNSNTLTIDGLINDFRNGGPASQTFSQYHNAPRKAVGSL